VREYIPGVSWIWDVFIIAYKCKKSDVLPERELAFIQNGMIKVALSEAAPNNATIESNSPHTNVSLVSAARS